MARTAQTESTTPSNTRALYVALELSKNTWKLGFAVDRVGKVRILDVKARDLPQLLEALKGAKEKLGLPQDAPVRSCYEAGRDGFWLDRFLHGHGIDNLIFEPASIEVDRRARKVKTDRLDVIKLVRLLVRRHEGECVARVVRVPPAGVEDERRIPRLLDRLRQTRTRITNAIRGALMCHGIDLDPRRRGFREDLAAARQWDGAPLPPGLLKELELEWEQLELLNQQISSLVQEQREAIRAVRAGEKVGSAVEQKAARLFDLRGIGLTGAFVLGGELFSWREIANRGEVGALAGLTGTPFNSGQGERDQGISKAGNSRVRKLMIELSWGWLRFQPQSKTARWYHAHIGKGGSRSKRKAIVAVARKLLVELWHYVEHGVIPTGAVLRPEKGQACAA